MDRTTSQTYAVALRVLAGAIALVAIGKHLAGGLPSPEAARQLLALRGTAAAVAIGLGLLCTPRRPVAQLRALAFALGLDVVFVAVGAIIVVPGEVWEQSVSLVAMMFAAAVFMPWSWRWQATFVAIAWVTATVVLTAVIPSGVLDGRTIFRVLLTLYVLAGLSVVGAHLADSARRQIEAARAEHEAQEHRRRHEERLDALARFAGGMAHQFNNLLGGILTHASVLRQGATGAGAAELDEIADAARRGRDLTEELLRFTRTEALRLAPTDVRRVLDSIRQLAGALLGEGGSVEVRAPATLPPIAADLDHLVTACTQIVLNARDAMRGRPNPRLTLEAAEETDASGGGGGGRWVRIAIKDNGRGMDPATLERAFEPFFTTKPMHQAKGLGLATVHRVMREHGGAVRVESEVGRGTTVHLLLPVAREPLPAPATATPALAVPQTGRGRATILVVDDEPIVRSSLKRALTRFGYQVLEAGDGGSALAAMQAAQPPVDLVILDLVLPGGGAGIFELLKAVRPEVKVLISSGYSPDGEAARGLATRVEGFLPKPYELTQLRAAVTQVLGS